MRRGAFIPLLALPLAIAPAAASAGSYARDAVDTCTPLNCRPQAIQGFWQPGEPFTAQVYAAAGECLRIAVTAQSVDTEMAVISPDVIRQPFEGWVNSWGSDNAGGNGLPLVRIDPTEATGYYTVLINVVGPFFPASASIRLSYGRYNAGNPNCD